jgi:hypothetical protein
MTHPDRQNGGRRPGSLVRKPNPRTARRRAWAQMRIHGSFSVRDICSLVDAMSREGFKKWLTHLMRHKIVIRTGRTGKNGEPGSFVTYRLIENTGPNTPTICPTCGLGITKPCLGKEKGKNVA